MRPVDGLDHTPERPQLRSASAAPAKAKPAGGYDGEVESF